MALIAGTPKSHVDDCDGVELRGSSCCTMATTILYQLLMKCDQTTAKERCRTAIEGRQVRCGRRSRLAQPVFQSRLLGFAPMPKMKIPRWLVECQHFVLICWSGALQLSSPDVNTNVRAVFRIGCHFDCLRLPFQSIDCINSDLKLFATSRAFF